MARLQFDDVNLDIKKKIVDYITRPEDLKSLCLTCNALRDIATPLLYRHMFLFVGGHRDIRVSGLLSRTNPGVKYIRKISLQLEKTVASPTRSVSDDSDDSSDDEPEVKFDSITGAARQAQFTVRLLLDFLPNDILEHFSWQNWEPFSMDNWILLMKKQKRLKAVEIASVDRPFMPVLEKQPGLLTELAGPKGLHFYPDNLDRLKACQKALEAQPNITGLQLSSGFEQEAEIPEDLQDSSTRPGLMSRTIFSHFLPFDRCQKPMSLRKLTLHNIDLRYATDTYMKVIQFSALESLVVGGCTGVDAVFAQMSKPHLRPTKLKKLRWFHEAAGEPHALEAFEGLLEATTGLKRLHIDINNISGLPKATAISHHGKTLEVLGVRSRMPSEMILLYDAEQFEEICNHCLELRQLGITFPITSVSDAEPSSSFTRYLRSCKKLRHLITINFHGWPSTNSPFINSRPRQPRLKPQYYDLYEHGLQRLAQQIFEASDTHSKEEGWGLGHRSMLAVIAFGANGATPFDTEKIKLKQLPFVRGEKIDAFGNRSMLAVKTVWKMVQFIEPDSDVLNQSLYDLHDVHNSP